MGWQYAYDGFGQITTNVTAFLGNGDGTFSFGPTFVSDAMYPEFFLADFNGDGKLDVLVSDDQGATSPQVYLGNGDGSFNPGYSFSSVQSGPTGADFNEDGKMDLAFSANSGANILIYLGDGTGMFTLGGTFPSGVQSNSPGLRIGDFNGDGHADIVRGPGPETVYLGDGAGQFSSATTVTTNPGSILSGDFNNDGRTDVSLGAQNIALSVVQASATVHGISITGGAPGFHQIFGRFAGTATEKPSSSGTVPLPGAGVTTVVAPPVLSPAGGAYSTAQAVFITDTTPGTNIYYTTDGTTPTVASTLYIGPILLANIPRVKIKAVAFVANYWPSPTATATYTDPNAFNFNGNFECCSPIQTNGFAYYDPDNNPIYTIELTSNAANQASSAFYNPQVNIQSFTTDFTFQLTHAVADGFTFTIQNAGAYALGSPGGSLGFRHIPDSVAVKFDLYNNDGEGSDSTGIYTGGAPPTVPSVDLTGSGIDLHSGDMMGAHITYDGTTLNLTLADLVTLASWSHPFSINIPAAVGGNTAYVGFTAGTGSSTANQQIYSWSYQSGSPLYYGTGFSSGSGLAMNGSAALSAGALELTNGGSSVAGSAFYAVPVNIRAFATDFNFQLTNPKGDGFTFTIQNVGPTALGSLGGSLGYRHIDNSVAIKFDLFNDAGEGSNSTGIYIDGAPPTVPASDLTGSGINLHGGDTINAQLTYDGTTLTLALADLVTHATWSHPFTINIPATVGGNTAYVGFTAGSGTSTATQRILNWTFE